jgi:hypothetical protein
MVTMMYGECLRWAMTPHRHPPLPFDSMCQDQPTLPLPPTVCGEPLNDTGALPVEYRTLAVQTSPGELKEYSVG